MFEDDEEEIAPEPYKIKVVEPIRLLPREERMKKIEEAGYNVFALKNEDIYIDLLTDSGTSALSDEQLAGLMLGKQSYAGSQNYYALEKAVKQVFGFEYFVPVHQGRAAENILFTCLAKKGDVIPSNMHFDTTRGNLERLGATPTELVIDEAYDTSSLNPFKGNMDLKKLRAAIEENKEKIPFIMMTVTNNTGGGQPASMENLKAVSEIAHENNIPFIIDACRHCENSYFIKTREKSFENKTITEISRQMFSYADGVTFSGKKDALVNIGGLIAVNDEKLFSKIRDLMIVIEGFPTYGGLACRDMQAMAIGMIEATDENYLRNRINQVHYLGKELKNAGVPVVEPFGGHAIYVDGKKFLPHVPQENFPSQSLAVELYVEGGVRGVELGTCCFGKTREDGTQELPALDLLRLTIPRRVYTEKHMKWVAQSMKKVFERRNEIHGMKLVYEAPGIRHFTAKFSKKVIMN